MKWRVLLELTGANGHVETRELATGHRPTSAIAPEAVGLTLAEGKSVLAAMQTRLVQAQADEYCDHRRICSRCGVQGRRLLTRPLAVSEHIGVNCILFNR